MPARAPSVLSSTARFCYRILKLLLIAVAALGVRTLRPGSFFDANDEALLVAPGSRERDELRLVSRLGPQKCGERLDADHRVLVRGRVHFSDGHALNALKYVRGSESNCEQDSRNM